MNIFSYLYYIFMLIIRYLFGYDDPSTPFPTTTTDAPCPFIPNSILSNRTCNFGQSGLYCDECGLRFANPNVKIVGGEDAVPHSWPSIVYLEFSYKGYFTVNGKKVLGTEHSGACGGTLIDRETVITAAHCFASKVSDRYFGQVYTYPVVPNEFYPTYGSMYTVVAGGHNTRDFGSAQVIKVKRFTIHENYNGENYLNDIAVIKLERPVDLDCKVQTACLPNPNIPNFPTQKNISAWILGWGDLETGGSSPDILQNTKITVYDSSLCNKVLPELEKNWNNQICAGEYAGGKDTCQGDSGGPLFVLDNINGVSKPVLAGVVSYGYGCGFSESPGVYTKVSAYLDWIKKNS